jgi:uncharacterized protein (TIGR04255 family)
MNFKEVKRVEYKHNILFEVVFQANFSEIMKISQEVPSKFQDIVRKKGYPEFSENIPLLPPSMPKELEEAVSANKVFRFFSEEKDWQISLANNFIALACSGNYRNYADLKDKVREVLQTFSEIYDPSYFTRIGLRYRDIANRASLPHTKQKVEAFIPKHIFPELTASVAEDIETLQKVSSFNDGNIKANVIHVLSEVSGKFRGKEFADEKSYIIDVDCFSESRIEGINNVLTKCDIFRRLSWNIFQWSITDALRGAMEESKS